MSDWFDNDESKRRRDDGMAKAKQNRSTFEWQHDAQLEYFNWPLGFVFTPDFLVSRIGLPSEGANKNNVVGAWINGMAKAGFIVWTGNTVKSQRVKRHAGEAKEWMKIK